MKYYDVSGVRFAYDFLFDGFLKDNIEKYEIEKTEVKHKMRSILVDEIELPLSKPLVELSNKRIYQEDDREVVIIYSEDIPIIRVEKDDDYKNLVLQMKDDLEGLSEIEYVYNGILFMELCLYYSIQSIHGSALQIDDKVVIFSGPSGIGKSTHVNYWRDLIPSTRVINDDKPLLKIINDTVFVAGSPWSGKTKMNENISLPLHSIVFLEQGENNEVIELSQQQKILHIMRNINRPRQVDLWNKVSNVIEFLIQKVPMYKAAVSNDVDAAIEVKRKIGA